LTIQAFSAIIKPSREEMKNMMDWMQESYEEYMELMEEAAILDALEVMEEEW
jgi:hypothetical protein